MNNCLSCYKELEEGQVDYHPKCIKAFYGVSQAPILEYSYSDMEELAKKSAEMSISVPGVQPKLSLGLLKSKLKSERQGRLTILDALDGQFILKPQNELYFEMPENEHLSMKLAELLKITTVPFNMIRLLSGELCFISKRIDRIENGAKVHMIDFHQILGLDDKYKGTHELLGKTIGDLSVNTMFDKLRFFESVVFSYIIGNNDMHLKNYSMYFSENGWILSPFYDFLNVKLILPNDKEDLALLLGGKRQNFKRNYFDRFGKSLNLNEKQIVSFYKRLNVWQPKAIKLINSSFLGETGKRLYTDLVEKRMQLFELKL